MQRQIFVGLVAGGQRHLGGDDGIRSLDGEFDERKARVVLVLLVEFLHRRQRGAAIGAVIVIQLDHALGGVGGAGDESDLGIEEGVEPDLLHRLGGLLVLIGLGQLLGLVAHLAENGGMGDQIIMDRVARDRHRRHRQQAVGGSGEDQHHGEQGAAQGPGQHCCHVTHGLVPLIGRAVAAWPAVLPLPEDHSPVASPPYPESGRGGRAGQTWPLAASPRQHKRIRRWKDWPSAHS